MSSQIKLVEKDTRNDVLNFHFHFKQQDVKMLKNLITMKSRLIMSYKPHIYENGLFKKTTQNESYFLKNSLTPASFFFKKLIT